MPLKRNPNHLGSGNYQISFKALEGMAYNATLIEFPGADMGLANGSHEGTSTPFRMKEPGNTVNFDELVITFLIDEDLDNYESIYRWMLKQASEEARLMTDCVIEILDAQLNPIKTSIVFENVFPVGISGFPLSAEADETTLTATARFAFEQWNIVRE